MYTSQFEVAEYESDRDILWFLIQNLKLGKISARTKILLDLLECFHTSKFEDNKNENDSNILRFDIWNINLSKLVLELKSH